MSDQPTQSPHTVFVSHAHADNAVCDRYVEALRARGLDVWYDRTNMQDGHMLNAEIEAQLEIRTAFVVLLTPASVASYWVNLEVAAYRSLAAHDTRRIMLPVRIAECKVPLLMAGIKWIDAVTLGFDSAVEASLTALTVPPISSSTSPASIETVESLNALGDAKYEQGHYAEALAIYERALAINPNGATGWRNKGAALTSLERNGEALNALERATALNPNDPVAWYNKGMALNDMERYDEALAAYNVALDLDDHDTDFWSGMGDALFFLERYEEATEAYEEALDRDPTCASAWAGMSFAMELSGHKAEAKVAMRRAKGLGWQEK